MYLKEKTYQYRRDFQGLFVCEGCGYETNSGGYDDRNFHDNVVPNEFRCNECGKTSAELGSPLHHVETEYPEGYQV